MEKEKNGCYFFCLVLILLYTSNRAWLQGIFMYFLAEALSLRLLFPKTRIYFLKGKKVLGKIKTMSSVSFPAQNQSIAKPAYFP